MTYLLDTNICIYALMNRSPEVLERLRAVGRGAVALSVITVVEIRSGRPRLRLHNATDHLTGIETDDAAARARDAERRRSGAL